MGTQDEAAAQAMDDADPNWKQPLSRFAIEFSDRLSH
jgi:hypothetical protein